MPVRGPCTDMEDIHWQEQRISVPEPKVEHHAGRGRRIVPLFPELAEILNEGYELAFNRLNDESGQGGQVVSGQ